ncbi:aspartate kinase [Calderihabitans maritimus]|uniref:Aspartokinase n=1 Tax=Calderihabitans maritimus TaxID=1246530 RepID=A0A1Z5HV12_9FIRM|nr:aspartate kinase [Calderihabitans maritimus]GAW93248.1 aspartate kinase [Calderihabitans maritimus]
MALVVQKYGGSSVADAEKIRRVARRVVECYKKGNQVVVVVSAMGDTTDELISKAREVTENPPDREMDMLLATGEQQSIALLAMAIQALGYPVISLTGPQAGILTDNVHTKAKILEVSSDRLLKELGEGKIVIVAGFQGITMDNEITTLGRGGSDTTAVAIAAALKADVCEIFTDVDGVFTADPRLVPSARKLSRISYDEMLELASLGALVLQPRAVEFAKQYHVRLHVRSSFNYNEGTIVEEVSDMEKEMVVSGVAHDLNVAKITVFDVPDRPGIACRLFSALARESINVDMIVQSQMRNEINNISFTIGKDDLRKAVGIIERIKGEIGASGFSYDDSVAKVSIVGAGMITNPGVAARMFEALAEEDINIQMISTSEIKVSCIIDAQEIQKAVLALHKKFGLEAKEKDNQATA